MPPFQLAAISLGSSEKVKYKLRLLFVSLEWSESWERRRAGDSSAVAEQGPSPSSGQRGISLQSR